MKCKGFSPCENTNDTIFWHGEEIKGRWIEGYFAKLHKTTYCFINEEPKDNNLHQIVFEQMTDWNLPNQYYRADIIPDTLCYCTGFKDKSNHDIFVGDKIIFYINNKIKLIGTVCYEMGAFGIGFDNILDYNKLEKMVQKYTGESNFWEGVKNDLFLSFWELGWNFNLIGEEGTKFNFIEIIGNKFEDIKKDISNGK